MFDRHQAEITVMQFTGHSLPVHQSMTVPRDFTLSHIVIQARLRQWNLHFHRLWNGIFDGVEGQYITAVSLQISLSSILLVIFHQDRQLSCFWFFIWTEFGIQLPTSIDMRLKKCQTNPERQYLLTSYLWVKNILWKWNSFHVTFKGF